MGMGAAASAWAWPDWAISSLLRLLRTCAPPKRRFCMAAMSGLLAMLTCTPVSVIMMAGCLDAAQSSLSTPEQNLQLLDGQAFRHVHGYLSGAKCCTVTWLGDMCTWRLQTAFKPSFSEEPVVQVSTTEASMLVILASVAGGRLLGF